MRLTGDPRAAVACILAARSCLRVVEVVGWYGLLGAPALIAVGACVGQAARAQPQGWASKACDMHAAVWVLSEAYSGRDVQGLALTVFPVAVLLLGGGDSGTHAVCATCVYSAGALALAVGRSCAAPRDAGAFGATGALLHAALAVAVATATERRDTPAPATRAAQLALTVVTAAPLLCGDLLTLFVAARLLAAAGHAAAELAAAYSYMQAYIATLVVVICVYHPVTREYNEALSSALLLLSLAAFGV